MKYSSMSRCSKCVPLPFTLWKSFMCFVYDYWVDLLLSSSLIFQ